MVGIPVAQVGAIKQRFLAEWLETDVTERDGTGFSLEADVAEAQWFWVFKVGGRLVVNPNLNPVSLSFDLHHVPLIGRHLHVCFCSSDDGAGGVVVSAGGRDVDLVTISSSAFGFGVRSDEYTAVGFCTGFEFQAQLKVVKLSRRMDQSRLAFAFGVQLAGCRIYLPVL